jgi:hypothetical protein
MTRWITTTATLLVLTLGTPARGDFITNGSFEMVPGTGPGFQGQTLMPTGWPTVVSTPDTYSNDGSYGLPPGGFGNFPGVTAFDGIRWVAGSAFGRTATNPMVGGESFGTFLTAPLTAGTTYRLDARLYQALRPDLDNPGGYHLFLAANAADQNNATLVGAIAPTTGVDAWEARSLAFVAPSDAAARPFLIFSPYQSTAGNAYPGLDAVSLNPAGPAAAVPEPTSLTLAGLGALVLGMFGRFRRAGRGPSPRTPALEP